MTTMKNKNNKSKKIRKGGNKTLKMKNKYNMNNRKKSNIVKMFLQLLNMVKLYHWKTYSYSQHQATDHLYKELNENIDEFVEILLGKDQSRIKMLEKRIDLIDNDNLTDFKSKIIEYRTFLTDMNMYFDTKKDSDLLNVRDEILGHINQFLYLLTFDK